MTLTTEHPPAQDAVAAAPVRANVAVLIAEQAAQRPLATAVIEQRTGRSITFGELARRVENVAFGFTQTGISNGARTILAVKPGIDFVVCVFALFRAGAVPVVVDPGMGRRSLLRCIAQAEPDALVGIPLAHALSLRYCGAFRTLKHRVTVGRRWLWGGATLRDLQVRAVTGSNPASTHWHDTAAILFTSGATGEPKGVVYHHGVFVEQVRMIRQAYNIQPGEVDCACFALFALFSVAMGVTVVLPDMDFSRPASADPARIAAAIADHKATMAFASPAVWRRLAPWLEANQRRLDTLRRVLIAGAAVPHATLAQLKPRIAEGGEIFTPYGATESLPLASIGATEVLGETRFDTCNGKGVCVGRPLPDVQVKVVQIVDGPVAALDETQDCAPGEVGEILVSSAVTTREYFRNFDADMRSKIRSEGFQPGLAGG
ncbi:MAG: AMP-binding protein, partial [Planctomycetes bacterium]|nr:AMP-binding protein [Planctomycetota bacterium]